MVKPNSAQKVLDGIVVGLRGKRATAQLLEKQKEKATLPKAESGKEQASSPGSPVGPNDPDDPDKDGKEQDSKKINNFEKQTNEQLRKSKRSFERQIREHREKLENYKKDPYKYDNKNRLKNAPSEEIRKQRIQGRIQKLEVEIQKFINTGVTQFMNNLI